MFFKMALRNIWKNRRRSIATISAVAVGYMGLALFAGYIESTRAGLAEQSIIGERLGHLTLVKSGYFSAGKIDPEKFIFSNDEIATLKQELNGDKDIELISPRLDLSGLVSNGRVSTIYTTEGISAEDLVKLRGKYADLPGKLDPSNPAATAMGEELATILGLKQGETAVITGTTASGLMNALDIEVGEVFNTGSAGTNDKFILMSLDLAQRLYDVQGAHRIVLKLADKAMTESKRKELEEKLASRGMPIEIKTWNELSMFYNQVMGMLESMFGFLFMLVMVVVGMSIFNTMGMSVMERTREIGTLRSLGMQRGEVVKLFRVEGMLLAIVGCLLGMVMTAANTLSAELMNVTYVPPGSTEAVPLSFLHLPENIVFYFGILVLIGMSASWVPAEKAAKMPVVDALGHV
ncbi:MAG: ABC transporter permease [Pseudomonadota bacterium]